MAAIYKRIDMINIKTLNIYKISVQRCQVKLKIGLIILISSVGEANCIIFNCVDIGP